MRKFAPLAGGALIIAAWAAHLAAAGRAEFDGGSSRARSAAQVLAESHLELMHRHTENNVHEDSDDPACTLLQEMFSEMKSKGQGELRLMALTAEPIVDANAPKGEFETMAAEMLRAGRDHVERTEWEDGRSYLRSATAITVSSNRCVLCHPNYKGLPADQPVGAFSYRLPLN